MRTPLGGALGRGARMLEDRRGVARSLGVMGKPCRVGAAEGSQGPGVKLGSSDRVDRLLDGSARELVAEADASVDALQDAGRKALPQVVERLVENLLE